MSEIGNEISDYLDPLVLYMNPETLLNFMMICPKVFKTINNNQTLKQNYFKITTGILEPEYKILVSKLTAPEGYTFQFNYALIKPGPELINLKFSLYEVVQNWTTVKRAISSGKFLITNYMEKKMVSKRMIEDGDVIQFTWFNPKEFAELLDQTMLEYIKSH